jgi:uncharacterized protein YndB with AHSA1/START domain
MPDRIEKRIEIAAPVSRVWRALTDSSEFGEWFRVKLDTPFAVGQVARGNILHPGYEHVVFKATVEAMEPERLFAFTWAHVRSFIPGEYSSDYTGQPVTRVEFTLDSTANGTLLTVIESGFDSFPADWKGEAFHRNEGGWAQQVQNIRNYVEKRS